MVVARGQYLTVVQVERDGLKALAIQHVPDDALKDLYSRPIRCEFPAVAVAPGARLPQGVNPYGSAVAGWLAYDAARELSEQRVLLSVEPDTT